MSGRRFGDLSAEHSQTCVGTLPVDGGIDARPDARPDAAIDAPPTARPFCDASGEPTLVGCWEFENNLLDLSGDNNNGTGVATTFAAGKVGQAAVIGSGGRVAVADSASLTPTAITIEAWINPTTLPTGGARMGIVDNDGQYGLFVITGGIQCTVSIAIPVTVVLPTGQWTHVACTFDGTTGRLFLGGVQVAVVAGGTALGAGNTNGMVIAGNSPTGDSLDGMVDQTRIWTAARTATQVCQAADGTGC